MKKVLFICLAVVLALSVGLIGCEGEPEPEPEPEPGGTLRVVSTAEAGPVGYPLGCREEGGFYHYPASQSLVKPAMDFWTSGDFEGILAESWSDANDATEWTFELRQGVKFHDGTAWNASACEWNIELAKAAGGRRNTFESLDTIDILGEHTIKLTFSDPYPTLIADLIDTLTPISPSAYALHVPDPEAEEPDISWFSDHSAFTGPFKLESCVEGSSYTYVPFDDYWGDAPLLDSIELYIIPDPITAKSMLQAGDAELYVYADPQVVHDLVISGGFSARYNTQQGKLGIFPSATNYTSVYWDLEVRQALEYAINRTAVTTVLSTGSVPFPTVYQLPMPSDSAGYDPAWGLEYDPDQAIALLESVMPGEGADGEYFQTTCFYETGNDVVATMALVIQDYLAAVNITMDVSPTGSAIRGMKTSDGWGDDNLMLADHTWAKIPLASDLSWWNYHSSRMMCDTYMSQDMKDIYDEMATTYSMATLETLHGELMDDYRELSCGIVITNNVFATVYADTLHTTWLLPDDRYWYCAYDWLA